MDVTAVIEAVYKNWVIHCSVDTLPAIYKDYKENASVVEENILSSGDSSFFVGIQAREDRWPKLVIYIEYSPGTRSGFNPGYLISEESNTIFVGAGTKLLCYDLEESKKLWEDEADIGFWGWRKYGEVVLMSAELELAAWSVTGKNSGPPSSSRRGVM